LFFHKSLSVVRSPFSVVYRQVVRNQNEIEPPRRRDAEKEIYRDKSDKSDIFYFVLVRILLHRLNFSPRLCVSALKIFAAPRRAKNKSGQTIRSFV
jgi:hypothetical protein